MSVSHPATPGSILTDTRAMLALILMGMLVSLAVTFGDGPTVTPAGAGSATSAIVADGDRSNQVLPAIAESDDRDVGGA